MTFIPSIALITEWVTSPEYPNGWGPQQQWIAEKAAKWAADQELDACCKWLETRWQIDDIDELVDDLRAARRPKPPSLKEEALKALKALDHRVTQVAGTHADTIRRALEALPDD